MNHVVNDISIKDLYALLSKKDLSAEVFQIYNKIIGHRRITGVYVSANNDWVIVKGSNWEMDFNKNRLLSDYNYFLSEEDSIANELNQDYKKLEEVGEASNRIKSEILEKESNLRALEAENFNPKTFGDLVGKCGIIYEVDYDSSIRQVTFNGTGKQISFIGNTKSRRIFIPWWSIDLWKDRLLSDYAFHYYVIDAVDSALKKINDAEIDFKKVSNARRVRVNEFVAKKMIGKELNDE